MWVGPSVDVCMYVLLMCGRERYARTSSTKNKENESADAENTRKQPPLEKAQITAK